MTQSITTWIQLEQEMDKPLAGSLESANETSGCKKKKKKKRGEFLDHPRRSLPHGVRQAVTCVCRSTLLSFEFRGFHGGEDSSREDIDLEIL
jgi:hypothetical protein